MLRVIIKQDHGQRQVTYQIRERVVVKRNSAHAIHARKHADSQENHQNGDTKT